MKAPAQVDPRSAVKEVDEFVKFGTDAENDNPPNFCLEDAPYDGLQATYAFLAEGLEKMKKIVTRLEDYPTPNPAKKR